MLYQKRLVFVCRVDTGLSIGVWDGDWLLIPGFLMSSQCAINAYVACYCCSSRDSWFAHMSSKG